MGITGQGQPEGAGEFVETHHRDQRAVLEEGDGAVREGGRYGAQDLGQDDAAFDLPGRQAEGRRGVPLPGGEGLQPTAHDLRQVGGGHQDDGDQHPPEHARSGAFGQQQGQQEGRHEQHGHQRDAPRQLDGCGQQAPQHGQAGAPAVGDGDAEGQSTGQSGGGDQQGEGQAAPAFCGHLGKAANAARQQGRRRQRCKAEQGGQGAAAQHTGGAGEPSAAHEKACDDRAPGFVLGIAAEEDEAVLFGHHAPAGAGMVEGIAGRCIRRKAGIQQRPADEGRQGEGYRGEDRQGDGRGDGIAEQGAA